MSKKIKRALRKAAKAAVPMLAVAGLGKAFMDARNRKASMADVEAAEAGFGDMKLKDFGPYNTMVDTNGNVMQVDLNSADMVRISTYNTKGLFTSHKFNHYIVKSAKIYGNNNIKDVAQFIQNMKKYPIAKGVICNLFNDACVASMMEGSTECLNELL